MIRHTSRRRNQREARPSAARDGGDLPIWVIDGKIGEHSRLVAIAHLSGNRVRWTKAEVDRIAENRRRPEFDERRSDPGHAKLVRLEAHVANLEAGHQHLTDMKLLRAPAHGLEALWLDHPTGGKLYLIKAPASFAPSKARDEPMNEGDFVRFLAGSPRMEALPQLRLRSMPARIVDVVWRRSSGSSATASRGWSRSKPVIAIGGIKVWACLTALLVAAFISFDLFLSHIGSPAHGDGQAASVDLTLPWGVAEAGLILLAAAAGVLSKQRVDGVLIDGSRNRLSLARGQGALWFGLVGGTYLTEAMWNAAHGLAGPAAKGDLWHVLGIVAGTPLVSTVALNAKANAPVAPTPAMVAAQSQGFSLPPPTPPPGQDAQLGLLDRNVTSAEASWADLYLGEEVGNRNDVDPSRLQQLVVTVGLAVVFVSMVHSQLAHVTAQGASMPTPDANFQWLLGISSGAYLASKAVPR